MKVHFLLLLFLSAAQILNGQTSKGDWLLNGGLTLDYVEANQTYESRTYIGIQPQAGYFFANGICFGAKLHGNFTLSSNNAEKGILPFMRGYIGKSKIRPFLQVDGGRIWENSYSTDLFNVRLGAGLFLSENVSIEGRLDYYIVEKYKSGQSTFSRNTGLKLGFGMNYFLTRNMVSKDSFSLLDNYLKKGTTGIGANGVVDFDEALIGNLYWEKMLADRLRMKVNWYGYHGRAGDDLDFISIHFLFLEAQPFFSLNKSTFFSPGAGVGYLGGIAGKPISSSHNLSLFARPGLTTFFRRGLLELGFEARFLYGEDYGEDYPDKWSSNAFLGGEYFFLPRLSIRGEVWANFFGKPIQVNTLNFWNEAGDVHFRLGFHYFLNKTDRNANE